MFDFEELVQILGLARILRVLGIDIGIDRCVGLVLVLVLIGEFGYWNRFGCWVLALILIRVLGIGYY
jgi:hypothetical protein